jgi:hypothetical protein
MAAIACIAKAERELQLDRLSVRELFVLAGGPLILIKPAVGARRFVDPRS